VYANYYFGQQPKLTAALYMGNTNRHRGTIVSPQRTPKGAICVLAAILIASASGYPGLFTYIYTQLSQERTAASPRALMSCTTHVKRQAKRVPGYNLSHTKQKARYTTNAKYTLLTLRFKSVI
jgi:hypothetical protein